MGAAKVKGETPLKLKDGRQYTLILDMDALLSIEDREGKPLPEVMEMAQKGFMTAVAAIAQAAFNRHHPDLSRSHVLEILRSDYEALQDALGDATEKAFPEKKAGNVPAKATARAKPRAKSRKTGTSSGRSGAKPG